MVTKRCFRKFQSGLSGIKNTIVYDINGNTGIIFINGRLCSFRILLYNYHEPVINVSKALHRNTDYVYHPFGSKGLKKVFGGKTTDLSGNWIPG